MSGLCTCTDENVATVMKLMLNERQLKRGRPGSAKTSLTHASRKVWKGSGFQAIQLVARGAGHASSIAGELSKCFHTPGFGIRARGHTPRTMKAD